MSHPEHAEAASTAAVERLARGLYGYTLSLLGDVRLLDPAVLESAAREVAADQLDAFAADLRERHDRLPDVAFTNASYDDGPDAGAAAC